MFSLRTFLAAGSIALGLLITPGAGYADEPVTLDAALTAPGLWEMESGSFLSEHKSLGFHWISSSRDVAQNKKKGTTFLGLPVCQILVRMKEGKVDHYTATFYNRGDMGDLRRPEYEALLRQVVGAITAHLGAQPSERGRDSASAVKAYGLEWKTPTTDYLLEYSFSRENHAAGLPYRGEFIRLEVSPKEAPKSFLAERFSTLDQPEKYDGPEHVTREENGDVFIKGVPMVDQGDKGYCVVATVERVLRLYGMKVDANELAQLAQSEAQGGTSVTAMTDSLKRLTARFKIKVRTQIRFDYNKFTRFVGDYNRLAQRKKQDQVKLLRGDGWMTDAYKQMDPELIREVYSKRKSEYTAFQRQVRTHIDKGVPMLWSVILGVMPETAVRQGRYGSHMRMIIGYNDETEELIFSDSWGIRHEFSKIAMFDAFCITKGLSSVEPL